MRSASTAAPRLDRGRSPTVPAAAAGLHKPATSCIRLGTSTIRSMADLTGCMQRPPARRDGARSSCSGTASAVDPAGHARRAARRDPRRARHERHALVSAPIRSQRRRRARRTRATAPTATPAARTPVAPSASSWRRRGLSVASGPAGMAGDVGLVVADGRLPAGRLAAGRWPPPTGRGRRRGRRAAVRRRAAAASAGRHPVDDPARAPAPGGAAGERAELGRRSASRRGRR